MDAQKMDIHRPWKLIDAKDMIVGRFCSQVAKLAVLGEKIVIINAKDAVMSGRRNWILKKYVHMREINNAGNPIWGPFHMNRPDTFLRQRIRQMCPKNARGLAAYKRVHVYISSIPKDKETLYASKEPHSIKYANASQLQHKYITLMDICDNMGYTRVRGASD